MLTEKAAQSSDGPIHYRIATYLNNHPEDLSQFVDEVKSLEDFAKVFDMLKPRIRALAAQYASRLILKMAKQVAGTGYRSGKIVLVKGFGDGMDIETDRSIENYIDQPELGLVKNMVSYSRQWEKNPFVVMIDHSYSMRGLKIMLAAITAATIAFHFKREYAVLAFSNRVSIIKGIEENVGPETVLERLFALELRGDTDVSGVLQTGLEQLREYDYKRGLLLTDGAWNSGGNPQGNALCFSKLSVLCFPPANPEKVQKLAKWGRGDFAFVEAEQQIAHSIIRCLG